MRPKSLIIMYINNLLFLRLHSSFRILFCFYAVVFEFLLLLLLLYLFYLCYVCFIYFHFLVLVVAVAVVVVVVGGELIFCYIKNLNLVWGVLQIFNNQYKCKHIRRPLSAHQAFHLQWADSSQRLYIG